MHRSRVVFPVPLEPMIEVIWPSAIEQVMWCRIWRSGLYPKERSSISMLMAHLP